MMFYFAGKHDSCVIIAILSTLKPVFLSNAITVKQYLYVIPQKNYTEYILKQKKYYCYGQFLVIYAPEIENDVLMADTEIA